MNSNGSKAFDWMERATCRLPGHRYNPDMIEASHREMTEREQHRARLYCVGCPVFDDCYDWVMETTPDPLQYAFAAGMTSRQRQRLRHELIDDPEICTCRRCRHVRKKKRRHDGKPE
jgi:hypothetical protein